MGTGMIQYKLVWGRDTETFSAQVTQLLEQGWELYSAPIVTTEPDTHWFFQAMVRWAENEGPKVEYDLARETTFKGLDAIAKDGFLDG